MTPDKLSVLRNHIEVEHEAFASGNPGKSLRASGQFHVEIALIADQATITSFVQSLVARSSLIIALYWRRQSAMCKSHAHHALMDAFSTGDAKLAEELMQSHLVDLASALDLTDRSAPPKSLRDAILGLS